MSGLYFITVDPPNAGVPLTELDGRPLSQGEMYQRNNFPLPSEPPARFDVVIPGRENRYLTVDDLGAYEQIETTMVLECAGNGRTLMRPVPDGTPWDLGGASVIVVRGVRLRDVLGSLPEEVVELVFTGADTGEVEPEGTVPYQFSLERSLAETELPLLVTHIGGESLDLNHGAPVRLIVPGHYAMKSVKWLTRIEGIDRQFRGHFVEKYRYFGDSAESEGSRVGAIYVRSLISTPIDGSRTPAGTLEVRGSAWTGMGTLTGVEISIDGGASWTDATMAPVTPQLAHWAHLLEVTPGPLSLLARASDSLGNVQPLEPRWNGNGYANNVCHQVTIEVT